MNANEASQGHLLVVDDNEGSPTRGLLQLHGYSVSDCSSGEQALTLLNDHRDISVCILDQKLSNDRQPARGFMDGMDVLRVMRRDHPSVAVIMFTAAEDRGTEAVAAGATFYYFKPHLDPAHLVALVDALVKMRRLQLDKDELQQTIDAMGVEVMVRDSQYRVLRMNKRKKDRWETHWKKTGFSFHLGSAKCYDCFEPTTVGACRRDCPCDEVFRTCEPIRREQTVGEEQRLIIAHPLSISPEGKVEQVVEVAIDITRRKRASEVVQALQQAGHDSLNRACKMIVEKVHNIFGQRVCLYMWMPSSNIYKGMACAGMHQLDFKDLHLEASDSLAKIAFKAGKPIVFKDNEKANHPCRELLGNDGVTQKLIVPLTASDERIGYMVLDNKIVPTGFEPEDIDILSLMSGSITEVLRGAVSKDADAGRITRLSALKRVDEKLVAAGNIGPVFKAIANELRAGVDARSAWLLYRTGTGEGLQTGAFSGDLNKEWLHGGHPRDVGIAAKCMDSLKPEITDDAQASPDFRAFIQSVSHPDFKYYLKQIRGVVAVPVLQGDVSLGVFVLFFDKLPGFGNEDADFLKDVAMRVAISLARIEDQRRIEALAVERAKLSDLSLLGAGLAHTLRTPLAEASAALALLDNSVLLMSQEHINNVSQAKRAILEASMLVSNLRELTRPQGNEPADIDLRKLFMQLRGIMGERLNEYKIRFTTRITPRARNIWAPPDAIKMVFVDLLANAVKAMPNGGILGVDANVDKNRSFARIVVSDTGPGLPGDVVKMLFGTESFMGTAPPGGIGLGLYLAKKVVVAAGGTITYKQPADGGSRFVILLPRGYQEVME
jgi:signal transduction histidine kinase/CheY-like chemotaxis protein